MKRKCTTIQGRKRGATRKSVSEIVAAILLTLIMVSLGAIVVLNLMEERQAAEQAVESQLDLAQRILTQALFDVVYVVWNTTDQSLYMIVSVGDGYLELKGVYVNDTLVNPPGAVVEVNGNPITDPQTILLPSNDLSLVKITPPTPPAISPGDTIIVRVSTSTGLQDLATGEAA